VSVLQLAEGTKKKEKHEPTQTWGGFEVAIVVCTAIAVAARVARNCMAMEGVRHKGRQYIQKRNKVTGRVYAAPLCPRCSSSSPASLPLRCAAMRCDVQKSTGSRSMVVSLRRRHRWRSPEVTSPFSCHQPNRSAEGGGTHFRSGPAAVCAVPHPAPGETPCKPRYGTQQPVPRRG